MNVAFDALSDVGDDALMVLFSNGDAAAARVLTFRHAPRAMALGYRLLGDQAEAEDVAQEAMMKLWKVAPDWRQGEAKVSTWLYRVVRNMCTDRLRRKRGVSIDAIPEPQDDAPGVEQRLETADRTSALQSALLELPERQRIAVTLRHLEGCSNPEIAEVLGVSIEAAESLTSRGKKTLAKLLAGQKETLGLEP